MPPETTPKKRHHNHTYIETETTEDETTPLYSPAHTA